MSHTSFGMVTSAIVNENHVSTLSPVTPLYRYDDQEIWVVCSVYQNNLISSHGRAWSLSHRRLRSTTNAEGWYKQLSFSNGKAAFVHRLVALAFVPGHFEGAVVNHKDGNKANNLWSNLEWVTHAQNAQHAFDIGLHSRKLSDEDVVRLRTAVRDSKRTFNDIASEFGISGVHVAQIVDGMSRGLEPMALDHRPRRGKLSREEAMEVVSYIKEGRLTYVEIAAKFSISYSNVANVAAGRVWPDLTRDLDLTANRAQKGWEARRSKFGRSGSVRQ